MLLRHFLTSVTRNFAEPCLHRHGHHGKRSAFTSYRDTDLTIKVSDSWDEVCDGLPIGWQFVFNTFADTKIGGQPIELGGQIPGTIPYKLTGIAWRQASISHPPMDAN